MIPQARVEEIARKVASANLRKSAVEAIRSEPASDSEGRDVWRITVVIKPGEAAKLEGDKLLDVLVGIQQGLREEGEERFALVEYATRDELEQSGDS
jgi:hypothetical protein